MLEITGGLHYQIFDTQYGNLSIIKELYIIYPDNKGIIKDGDLMIITNNHLVENTLYNMFFGIRMKIDFKTIYYYELEKDVLFKIDIKLFDGNEVNKFLRKNKIKNLLETDNEN